MNVEQSFDTSLYAIFGSELGIPNYVVLLFILLILLCALSEKTVAVTSFFGKVVFIGVVIAGYFGIFFVFMMAETTYGSSVIAGWQSRYFVPFVPAFVYCLCGLRGSLEFKKVSMFLPIWFVEILFILGIFQHLVY